MTDWKRCMFLLLMCLMTVCAENHKVVMKILLEKEPWLLCNKWKRDHYIPNSLISSDYMCTAHNQSSSLQISCSSQTQGKSKYEFLLNGLYLSKSNGPLTSVRVFGTGGEEEESVSNTQQTVLESTHNSNTPSEDNTTPTQENNWLTQTTKECINRSGDNYKESCAGGIAAAVVVSFLVGAITGVAILFLIYIHRIKRLCFQTKKKAKKKFAAKKKDDKSENVVKSEPVIVEIPTEVCQYEDLYSSVRQTRAYDVLKYDNVPNGCHHVPGCNSIDDYDSIRNSDVPIVESDSVRNSHCNAKPHMPASYEPVEIDASGIPVQKTKLTNINGSSKDISISGDASCDESVSHDYFILEATPGDICIDNIMDCSRNETGNGPKSANDKLESQSDAENSSDQTDPESLCRQSHVYCILEAQKDLSDETVIVTERNICTYMNNQTVDNPVNSQNESKEKSHESVTPNDPSIEQSDHVYFVLEIHDKRP